MKKNRVKLLTAVAIIILFGISVLIRIPHLNRPLGVGHDILTGSTLQRLDAWSKTSFFDHKLLPISTYNNKGDKNLSSERMWRHPKDERGRYYYNSYPPFGYIVPYAFFSLFNITPEILPLRIFNLLVHLLCCLLIFFMIAFLTQKWYRNKINIPALIGFCVYTFSTLPMWYHGITYHVETFVQLFFIASIFTFLKTVDNPHSKKNLVLFFLSVFFMCYTEWIGYFFALFAGLYLLINIKKSGFFKIILTLITSVLTSFGLLFFHYSYIAGYKDVLASFFKAFFHRSGQQELQRATIKLSKSNIKELLYRYFIQSAPFLIYGYTAFWGYFFKTAKVSPSMPAKIKIFFYENKLEMLALYISLLPAIAHNLVLISFTMTHIQSCLKTNVFFAIFIALFSNKLLLELKKNTFAKTILLVLFSIATAYSARMTAKIPRVTTTPFQRVGQKIAEVAQPDEIIFVKQSPTGDTFYCQSEIAFYAHRNMTGFRNEACIEKIVSKNDLTNKVIIFELDEMNKDVASIKRFRL